VVVIGKENSKWGERPIAVVKARGNNIEKRIKQYLDGQVQKGRIAKWWVPYEIIFVDKIPLTSVGKIDKRALKEKYTRLK